MMLNCIKYIVIIYNFIFWLLGLAILGCTVFMYMDGINYIKLDGTAEMYATPFFVMMVLGLVMSLVGFLGCCGAIRESTRMLGCYFFFVITMSFACGTAVYWSLSHGDDLRKGAEKEFRKLILEQYGRGNNEATELAVDSIQKTFACCGNSGPSDWALSVYNTEKSNATNIVNLGVSNSKPYLGFFKVPASCCVKNNDNCETSRIINTKNVDNRFNGINGSGCLKKLDSYIAEQWNWLIIIGAVVLCVQIFALLFACCLCCALSRAVEK